MSYIHKKSEVISLEESDIRNYSGMIELEDNSNQVVEVDVQVNNNQSILEVASNNCLTVIQIKKPKIELHSFDSSTKSVENTLKYVGILNQIIEDIILGLPEYLEALPKQVDSLIKFNKNGILLVSILNTGILKKLSFIKDKFKFLDNFTEEQLKIDNQIEYWKQYLSEALIDTSQQEVRYRLKV